MTDGWEETGRLVRSAMTLEAQRVAAMAALGGGPGAAGETVAELDAELDVLLGGLARRGAGYPLHLVARRYDLSGSEYLVLQLALMPFHAPESLQAVSAALAGDGQPRLSLALTLLGAPTRDWPRLRRELDSMALFRERLVLLEELDDSDHLLLASPALLELLGLS